MLHKDVVRNLALLHPLPPRLQIVKCIDVEKAECLYEPDREMIKNNIIRHHGSLSAFDTALKLQLVGTA